LKKKQGTEGKQIAKVPRGRTSVRASGRAEFSLVLPASAYIGKKDRGSGGHGSEEDPNKIALGGTSPRAKSI